MHRSHLPFPALTLLGLASLPAAASPDVTDIAPRYRGDLSFAYQGTVGQDRLVEESQEVGSRTLSEHTLTYRLDFSVLNGLGLVVELPHWVDEGVAFGSGNRMEFDPLQDDGTMIGTGEVSAPAVSGAGLGGTWVGLRGSPIHQEAFKYRQDRVSWVLEAGYRFKDNSNFWTTGDGGKRGAGPGASALRLTSSWSTTFAASNPYLRLGLVQTGRLSTKVTDASGQVSDTARELRPASTVGVDLGTEFLLSEYGEDGGRVAFDLRSQASYTTWQDVPSGLYLPSVLDASSGTAVTQDESLRLGGRIGVNWRMVEYLQLNLNGGAGFVSSYQPEHLYGVTTGLGAWEWMVGTSLRFRARDPMVADLFDR